MFIVGDSNKTKHIKQLTAFTYCMSILSIIMASGGLFSSLTCGSPDGMPDKSKINILHLFMYKYNMGKEKTYIEL